MSDQNRKVLSFGPFELSIGNRLLTNGTKVVPLGGRAFSFVFARRAPYFGTIKPRFTVL